MVWWIIGAIAAFLIFRFSWHAYIHPAHVLGRQAANMNWFAIGRVEDDAGFKDVCYGRDGMEAKVSYASGKVFLLKPLHDEPFKDFVELERWLVHQEDYSPTGDIEPFDISMEKNPSYVRCWANIKTEEAKK